VPANDVRQLIDSYAPIRASTLCELGLRRVATLSAEWFKLMTKTDVLHVASRQSHRPAGAVGNHVDMMFDTLPSVLPLVQEANCARSASRLRSACPSAEHSGRLLNRCPTTT